MNHHYNSNSHGIKNEYHRERNFASGDMDYGFIVVIIGIFGLCAWIVS